jgi:hypothetical protein
MKRDWMLLSASARPALNVSLVSLEKKNWLWRISVRKYYFRTNAQNDTYVISSDALFVSIMLFSNLSASIIDRYICTSFLPFRKGHFPIAHW